MRVRISLGLVVYGLLIQTTWAQAPAAKPEFEVASVRPSEQLDQAKVMAMVQSGHLPKFGPQIDGLRAEYSRMPLKQLIANAYEVKDYQVTGPDALSAGPFDIVARMPEGSTKDDAPKMLRTLLEQRFHLEAKKSTEEHPVYALVVGKGGPKLKESATKPVPLDPNAELKPGENRMNSSLGPMIVKFNPADGSTNSNMGENGSYLQKFDPQARTVHFEGTGITMSGFAQLLSALMTAYTGGGGRPVIDETGLKGYYDLTLDISIAELMARASAAAGGPGGAPSTEATAPGGGLGIEDSIQRLGLKLEPKKAPTEQVVVSHLDKTPTEN